MEQQIPNGVFSALCSRPVEHMPYVAGQYYSAQAVNHGGGPDNMKIFVCVNRGGYHIPPDLFREHFIISPKGQPA